MYKYLKETELSLKQQIASLNRLLLATQKQLAECENNSGIKKTEMVPLTCVFEFLKKQIENSGKKHYSDVDEFLKQIYKENLFTLSNCYINSQSKTRIYDEKKVWKTDLTAAQCRELMAQEFNDFVEMFHHKFGNICYYYGNKIQREELIEDHGSEVRLEKVHDFIQLIRKSSLSNYKKRVIDSEEVKPQTLKLQRRTLKVWTRFLFLLKNESQASLSPF